MINAIILAPSPTPTLPLLLLLPCPCSCSHSFLCYFPWSWSCSCPCSCSCSTHDFLTPRPGCPATSCPTPRRSSSTLCSGRNSCSCCSPSSCSPGTEGRMGSQSILTTPGTVGTYSHPGAVNCSYFCVFSFSFSYSCSCSCAHSSLPPSPAHWSEASPRGFGPRARLVTTASPAYLLVSLVEAGDVGRWDVCSCLVVE